MADSICLPRLTRTVAVASIVALISVDMAFAVPPTMNSSGLSPQQCYRRDSDCTQFCGEVTGDLRYECFGICDRMLDRCLTTGDWSDSLVVDPGTGGVPDRGDLLSGHLMRMMMILSDSDGDGVLSPSEIQSVKDRVFSKAKTGDTKEETSGAPKTTAPPASQ